MKKIILGLTCFLTIFISPLADEININDKVYQVANSEILRLEGLTYNPHDNVLTLENATLETVKIDDNLTIKLKGISKINNTKSSEAIKCKNLKIYGSDNATLEITSINRGIDGKQIIVNNATITVNCEDVGFLARDPESHITINGSHLTLNCKSQGFRVFDGDLYVNSSTIKGEVAYLKGGVFLTSYINSSDINLTITRNPGYISRVFYINGDSNIFIYDPTTNLLTKGYIIDDNLKMYYSLDNQNYQEGSTTKKVSYLKINNKDNLNLREEEIKANEKALAEKEKTLTEKEKSLTEKEKLFLDEKTNLTLKEKELLEKENNLVNKEKTLTEKEKNLLDLKNKFNLKDQEFIKREENIKKGEKIIKIKQEKLLALSNQIQEETKINENNKNINLKQKQELLKYEETLKSKEEYLNNLNLELIRKEEDVKNDNLLCKENATNNIENPKTFDDLKSSVILLVLSLLGFLVIIIKRRKINENL